MRKKILLILVLCVGSFSCLLILLNRYSPVQRVNTYDLRESEEILHPYLGFVSNESINKDVNKFGFFGPEISKKKDTQFDVYIMGGSFAMGYYYSSGLSKLKDQLQEKIPDKEIRIFNLALGGYKQPQQLHALIHFLSLGYSPDLVININGFNEAALGFAENYASGITTYYPRTWTNMTNISSKSLNNLVILIQIRALENIIKYMDRKPVSIINSIINNIYISKIGELEKINLMSTKYQLTGSEDLSKMTENQVIDSIVNTWIYSSIQMHLLAKSNNFIYVEFLQPNQYLQGSKKFSEEEIKRYIVQSHPYGIAIKKIYPTFLKKVQDLQMEGVDIYDLTHIFSNNGETIYIDSCCHVNELGNEIIGKEIANLIRNKFFLPTQSNGGL